eukprot:4039286-Amphidinium_carterae.1
MLIIWGFRATGGFGVSQRKVENIISGLLILVTRPFQQGDWIECEEVCGTTWRTKAVTVPTITIT